LATGERLVGELTQRRSAPVRQRRRQQVGRPAGIAGVQGGPALMSEGLEPVCVNLSGLGCEQVPAFTGLDDAVTERLAQPGDVDLDGLGGRGRRAVAPEGVDEFVHRDALSPLYEQHGEQRTLARPAQWQFVPVLDDLEPIENPKFQRPGPRLAWANAT